ncbi:hypothetical protein DUNSADRAFT_14162 [Dunaliella salina]|uniref:Uncharacterized protein n=1 Tax=Dunaliella salina TaxID=3046 RepID=A0ABQ7H2S3_DUNSA|nr:hypothetical protein DUNSADRAFT_14162 [Dunaliella salina]|eukprot:KAF5841159.1 hypothetical protein DUNSADRAFT_14162 [Dunaliella salina]
MSYDQVLLQQNMAVLRLWPTMVLICQIAQAAQLISVGGCSTGLALSAVCCMCCWGITKAISSGKTSSLRGLFPCLFLFFGFTHLAFCFNYMRGKDTVASVHVGYYLSIRGGCCHKAT